MTAFVALLRAVNVGGTGKLPMSDLTALCEAAGFTKVETYIASGNVVFEAAMTEDGSNGPVEGQVNRLKTIKRQMYGRAGLKLLRARVRHKGS